MARSAHAAPIGHTTQQRAAAKLQQEGRFAEAEKLYRKAVAANPRDVFSLTNLGVIAFQTGQMEEAERRFCQVTRIMPNAAEAHVYLGATRFNLGRLEDAAESLRWALSLQPKNAHAHTTLGQVLRSQYQLDAAIGQFRLALEHDPDSVQAAHSLATALTENCQPDAAITILLELLRGAPNRADMWNDLGVACGQRGQMDDAAAHYAEALRLQPASFNAHYNLSGIRHLQGRLMEAVEHCHAALRLQPHLPLPHVRLGQILFDLGQLNEAVASFTKALQFAPEQPDALHGLGNALQPLGQYDEAIDSYLHAIKSRPGTPSTWVNLGQALKTRSRLPEAIAALTEAVRLSPGHVNGWLHLVSAKLHAADWADLDHCERQVLDGINPAAIKASPFILFMVDSNPAQQLFAARQWVKTSLPPAVPLPRQPPHPGDRIRIGYLSADFRKHATAFLMTGLIESHDRSKFETIAYSIGPDDGSEDRQRLEAAFDGFVDLVALSNEQAAQRIQADRVDILVDLKGHTAGSRPGILAYRPAPVQVNYLGYPGTMGADFVDYIIVDPIVAPTAMAPFFTEKLVHLPHSYQPNMNRPIAATNDTRADHGLPEGGFIFCCFNQSYKIKPPVFDVWMRLLGRVPDSVLWLLHWNDFATANLRQEAAARGINPSRLIFAEALPVAEHLARHRHVDLWLDTLPVCAHTTASDALWAGAPLICCMGETFVSRVSASLLAAMGLSDLITETLADYEALALRLARNRVELAAVRHHISEARVSSPLFNTKLATRHIEAAFTEMYHRHGRGMAADAFAVASLD